MMRKVVKVLASAGAAGGLAVCGGEPPEVLKGQEAFRDRVCACPDVACIERAQEEATEWARTHGMQFMGTERDRRRLAEIQAEMGACLTRLAGGATP